MPLDEILKFNHTILSKLSDAVRQYVYDLHQVRRLLFKLYGRYRQCSRLRPYVKYGFHWTDFHEVLKGLTTTPLHN